MISLHNWCWMAVEPQYAPEVHQLLHSLRAHDRVTPAASADLDPSTAVPASGRRRRNNSGGVVWDDAEYNAFMVADKESYRRVRAFCDVLADASGERLTTSSASSAAGITPTQLRAGLGKFTIWINATIEDDQWPFGWAYGEDVDPENPGEFHYTMTDEQASAWRAAGARVTV